LSLEIRIYIYIHVIFSRDIIEVYILGAYPFYGKGPHLLWVGSQDACGEITVSGITNCPNFLPNFFLHIRNLKIWPWSWS